MLATATNMKNSKSNRISRLENLLAAAIVFVLWAHRMLSQGDYQSSCLLNHCDSCGCGNHWHARLMAMGPVGFLGVSCPYLPPTYFHMPPPSTFRLNAFECAPIGAPHRGSPQRYTRKSNHKRGYPPGVAKGIKYTGCNFTYPHSS